MIDKKIEYVDDCKLMPSNILNAFINAIKQRTVNTNENFPTLISVEWKDREILSIRIDFSKLENKIKTIINISNLLFGLIDKISSKIPKTNIRVQNK